MAGILTPYFGSLPFASGGILGGLRSNPSEDNNANALPPADQSIMAQAAFNAWQRRLNKSGRRNDYSSSAESPNPVDARDIGLQAELNSPWYGNFAPLAPWPNVSSSASTTISPNGNVPMPRPRPSFPATVSAQGPRPQLAQDSPRLTTDGDADTPSAESGKAGPADGLSGADFLARLGQAVGENSSMLMALGGGMMTGGLGRGFQAAAAASEADSKRQAENASRNATLQALLGAGVPTAVAHAAASNPDLLKAIGGRFFGQAPETIRVRRAGGGEALMTWDPMQRRYVPAAGIASK